jgi:hypothetical protein
MTFLLRASPDTKSPLARYLSKTTLAVGLVAIVGLAPFQMLTKGRAIDEAGTLVATVGGPTHGEVELTRPRLDIGTVIVSGDPMLRFPDGRRNQVDLARQLEQLKAERPDMAARLDRARAALANFTEQMQTFVDARILQLEARQDELAAELAAAQARNLEAKSSLARAIDLTNKGWRTKAQLDQVYRDSTVAEKLETAAEKRLESVGVELAAARRGVVVGASSDYLRYQQRVDRLEAEVNKLDAALTDHDRRITNLLGEFAPEVARPRGWAASDVATPFDSRI